MLKLNKASLFLINCKDNILSDAFFHYSKIQLHFLRALVQ